MSYAGNIETDNDLKHKVASTLLGSCTTAADTAAKAVSLADFDAILDGVTIYVRFLYSNTAANPTLNVNNTGAKPIYTRGVETPGTSPESSWDANSIVSFTYEDVDSGRWILTDANVALVDFVHQLSSELTLAESSVTPYVVGNTNDTGSTLNPGTFVWVKNHSVLSDGLYTVKTTAIVNGGSVVDTNMEAVGTGLGNNLKNTIPNILYPNSLLNNSHNMNSVDTGTYYQSGGSSSMPANAPSGANNAFIMVVKARISDRIQFWYSVNTQTIYVRQTADWSNGSSSTWTAWKSITPT